MTATNSGPQIEAARVIADLRELDRRTGGAAGARRVAWGEQWRVARAFLQELLDEIGLRAEPDEAGNLWATLGGERRPALAIGSHLDSVPSGGWLDGALGVMAAVGVLRAFAQSGERPSRDLALVDWADEEGARFGSSLLGSSAFAGSLDVEAVRELPDQGHERLVDVLAANGVELDHASDAGRRRAEIHAYLELHIEQGPVLAAEGLRAGAVAGCVGVERHRFTFTGRTGHAGTTPMDHRHDAGLAAATTALAIERTAAGGGTATTGALELVPGIVTAVAGRAELLVDLRHGDAQRLAAMLTEATEAARAAAAQRGCDLQLSPVFAVHPVAFDEQLVALARESCIEVTGADRVLTSGALHDAAAVALRLPAAMVFAPSIGGVSHAADEDTADGDLSAAIETFAVCVQKALRLPIGRGPDSAR
jgi:hydantoinase/carbamoylase family amidase